MLINKSVYKENLILIKAQQRVKSYNNEGCEVEFPSQPLDSQISLF